MLNWVILFCIFLFYILFIYLFIYRTEMCILFLYLNDRQEDCPYRLIVANNRDEYWDRPTATAAFRGEKQQWIGGLPFLPKCCMWIAFSDNLIWYIFVSFISQTGRNYLDDLLLLDNEYFERMADAIYTKKKEVQLNKIVTKNAYIILTPLNPSFV